MTLSAGGDKLAVRKPPVDGFLAGILEDGVVTVSELVTRGLPGVSDIGVSCQTLPALRLRPLGQALTRA